MTFYTFLGNIIMALFAVTVCAMLVCLTAIVIRVTINIVRYGEWWP